MVLKLGVPGRQELAMGTIASGGVRVLNEGVVRKFGISQDAIDRVASRERRERAYRGARPEVDLRDRTGHFSSPSEKVSSKRQLSFHP